MESKGYTFAMENWVSLRYLLQWSQWCINNPMFVRETWKLAQQSMAFWQRPQHAPGTICWSTCVCVMSPHGSPVWQLWQHGLQAMKISNLPFSSLSTYCMEQPETTMKITKWSNRYWLNVNYYIKGWNCLWSTPLIF